MIHNIHLIKAIDCYPYNIEECVESLNYALAYDNENALALCLMGRIHSEIMKDNESAKTYFQKAFSANKNYLELYAHFIHTLMLLEEYTEALRLIEYALKAKGINRGNIFYKQAEVFERMKKYKKAKKSLKNATLNANNKHFISDLEELQNLIDRKQKLISKKIKRSRERSQTFPAFYLFKVC